MSKVQALFRWLRSLHILAVVLTLVALASAPPASASEIQSLMMRGLPTALDPEAEDQIFQRARAYPLRPLVRLPFYGLPYDLVETSSGRLVFRVDDLVLPGRIPIRISRVVDTGMATDFPPPPEGAQPRYRSDFGGSWSLSLGIYLQRMGDSYVL